MSRRPAFRLPRPFVILLVLAFAAWHYWQEGQRPPDAPPRTGPALSSHEALHGARLLEHRDNDGDSFQILHNGQAHHFRLYFADSPEKRRHQHNGDRLRDQGRYFGGLEEARTIALGLEAKKLAENLLRSRPFTIHTRWHQVYDSGRYYAFVIFDDGEDLGEKLVRAGLARIHTTGAPHPDGRSAQAFEKHLRRLEQEARSEACGGWAR
ncbi:MAG TPA: hypothetical protein DIT64_14415 [Verrucomicrobiales bacterium]|nr:hypothetical protein [Verrucomicrobiales bacterium]